MQGSRSAGVEAGSSVPDLELDKVAKTFGDGTKAVADFSLAVEKGEFIAFLGPSGCGKTTTLRMVAGFETISSGDIRIRGERINELPPERRPTSMIFQNYALFPHMDVERNVAYGLAVKGMPKPERRAKVARMLETLGLSDVARRAPGPALGRPAPARRACAQPRGRARHPLARRAARRARRQSAQGHPGRAQAAAAQSRHHLRLRHARAIGGAHPFGPHRRDEFRGASSRSRSPTSSTHGRGRASSPDSSDATRSSPERSSARTATKRSSRRGSAVSADGRTER